MSTGLGTYIRESFNQGDMELIRNIRNPFLQVILEEVLQLRGELNPCWATSDDDLIYRQKRELASISVIFDLPYGVVALSPSRTDP